MSHPITEMAFNQSLTKFKEDRYMVTYMMLMKLTDQGIKNVKEAPERIEAGLT